MSPTVPPISTSDDVDVLGHGPDRVLDLVGDVRNHLHRATEVVAAPFLLDDAQVDLAGCPVGVLRRQRAGEPLVVAQVEVRFGAIVGDVHLAVLVRAHRARIDVDIRVELLKRDAVAVPFEQAADRGGGETFAERGHHAARHENVFGGSSGRHMKPILRPVDAGRCRVANRRSAPPANGAPLRDPSACPR